MNQDDKEKLSQLMDGEWQNLDAAQSVKAVCTDEEQQSTWSRYHLIRDVIRNEEISIDTSLAARISSAIEDEPAYSNVSAIGSQELSEADSHDADNYVAPQKPNRWLAGVGGLAVAASVAMATVVGLNVWQGAPSTGASVNTFASIPATIVPGAVLPEVEYVSNKGSFWVNPEATRSAASEKRLNMFLSSHIENSPTATRSGMLPYSRLVGYDTVAPE